jgi:hypothetical protein
MKPLNFDNSPCSPTSSNCVIWGGPDLACINVCKGDSVTDVVAKLATELCTLLDTFNISAYDISCFNLVNCAPQTFTDLINFLIVKVCELDNGTSSGGGTTPSTGCPTDCFVEVAPCFVVGTATVMNLTNYVTTIGERICNLVDSIAAQQLAINSLNNRVTALEAYTPPTYTTPTMVMVATLPSTPPLLINTTQPINIVIESFINDIWFSFVGATGDSGCLASAVSLQTVLPSDASKANPASTMSAVYAGLWVAPAVTVCDTIKNIWACIKDLRDAPLQSPFYLYGTTTDAGNNKTTAISRNNSIYTIGADSYFNTVRIGLGNSNISTNTAVGTSALLLNTTGAFNTAIGTNALSTNTTGSENVAIGTRVLSANNSGLANVGVGDYCLLLNTSGQFNVAIGKNSMAANTIGSNNVGIGMQALFNQTTAQFNTAIGSQALSTTLSGNFNTGVGSVALGKNILGEGNTALGYTAGAFVTGGANNTNSTDCIYIGKFASSYSNSDTNQIVIGANAEGNGSNTTTIGNTSSIDFYLHGDMNLKNTTAVTTASVSQTDYLPITINGVAYKLLLAV